MISISTRLPPVIHGRRGTSGCEAPIDSLGEGETTLDWACDDAVTIRFCSKC